MKIGGVVVALSVLLEFTTGQPDYTVTLVKVAPCSVKSDTLADISSLKVSKWNQSTVCLQGKIVLHKDVSDDTTIKIAVNKQSLGTWVQVPINFSPHSVCDFVKKDTNYFPTLQRNSNLPKTCPFRKGIYEISDSVVNVKKLPSYLPKGCFRVDFILNNAHLKQPSCYSAYAKVSGSGLNPVCH